MADLPIIFSAPMVRALLDGSKTQTRRTHPPEPRFAPYGCTQPDLGGRPCWWDYWANDRAETHRFNLPYAVGDRLYVREACATWGRSPAPAQVEFPAAYAADDPEWEAILHDARSGAEWKIRRSIHMPRWASRLTLTVTDVWVQRLQDISEADAKAEGAPAIGADEAPDEDERSYRWGFINLWNSLLGSGAWERNPWVAAYTFTVARGNIDQIGGR